ncbi:neurotrypsin-like [Diadema antillarum]|uniref:neurotrypsin-like n=1 Tax=Diadema antillarum TaxID=105358 RepID=UPI003A850453
MSCRNEDVVVGTSGPEDGDIRLTDGGAPWKGRLHIFYDLKWGTVCNDSWSYENALVVCRQLGYDGVVSTYEYFGPGYGPIQLGGVVCTGDEDTLTDCSHSEWGVTSCTSHERDVAVECTEERLPGVPETGAVRLADGSGSHEGRVEIFYDSQWGTVCDDDWDILDATVVCRQLGFSAATDAFRWAFFGGGSPTQPIYLDNVHCDGNEAELSDCEHNGWEIDNCVHYEDAGVRCFIEYNEGDIRLADGPMSRDGRLEIYHNNEWGTVCNTTWGPEEAEVTCRQLGNDGVNNVYYSPTPGNGSIHLSRVDCTGSETELLGCDVTFSDTGNSSCTHGEDVGVDCYTLLSDPSAGEGDTRLVDGENSWEGRLQVFHDRKWGTVCNDSRSYENALVVCRQLGYAGVVSSYRYFGPGYGPIHLGGMVCTGNEDALTDCSHNEWDDTNCTSHENDIGVQCTEEMFVPKDKMAGWLIAVIVITSMVLLCLFLDIVYALSMKKSKKAQDGATSGTYIGSQVTPTGQSNSAPLSENGAMYHNPHYDNMISESDEAPPPKYSDVIADSSTAH